MITNASDNDTLGTVDLIVIGFPDGVPNAGEFTQLVELVEAGTLRILDLEFVKRDAVGSRIVELDDLPPIDGLDKEFWSGVSSHLLDTEDLEALTQDMTEGELATVLLVEHQWLSKLVDDWATSGARIIAETGVSPDDLTKALDAAELREEKH